MRVSRPQRPGDRLWREQAANQDKEDNAQRRGILRATTGVNLIERIEPGAQPLGVQFDIDGEQFEQPVLGQRPALSPGFIDHDPGDAFPQSFVAGCAGTLCLQPQAFMRSQ